MNLSEVRDALQSLPGLERRLNGLMERLREAERELSALLLRYEKEQRDVERIRRESLSSFLLRLAGKYENRLERELREELEAKTAYDRQAARLNDLRYEVGQLEARIAELGQLGREYGARLDQRRSYLERSLSSPSGQEYFRLEAEMRRVAAQHAEIDEAARVAARAMSTARGALSSLQSAEGWATYDIFTKGGIISHAVKYSHIDSAEADFHRLSSQLRELGAELADVEGFAASPLAEISSTQRIIDYWFDNIFTDLSVRSQVQDNIGTLHQLMGQIGRVEAALRGKRRELARSTEKLRIAQEHLLVSLEEPNQSM